MSKSDERQGAQAARPDRRLRVLTMVDRLMTSGAEIIATRVATSLDKARFESIMCSTRPSASDVVEEVEASGTRVLVLDRQSPLDVRSWQPLLTLLKSARIDVIHAHKFGSNVWASCIARLADVPVLVAHEHSRSYEGEWTRRLLDRHWIGRSADVLLSTAEEDRRRMIELEGIDPAKVRHMPNGISLVSRGNGADVRRELGLARETPLIGTVCTLRAEKAVDVFIRAATLLVRDYPSMRAVIVGDGPERTALEDLANQLGLDGAVLFVGSQPQRRIPDFLDSFDVAVSSSDIEGSPLAILEFMAAGRAIVATSVGGVPQLIEDHVHGMLVPPQDPTRLADAIRQVMSDSQLRAALGANARARQDEEFSLRLMVERLQVLYESLYWGSKHGRREAATMLRPHMDRDL